MGKEAEEMANRLAILCIPMVFASYIDVKPILGTFSAKNWCISPNSRAFMPN